MFYIKCFILQKIPPVYNVHSTYVIHTTEHWNCDINIGIVSPKEKLWLKKNNYNTSTLIIKTKSKSIQNCKIWFSRVYDYI